jgi:hypothetical protein
MKYLKRFENVPAWNNEMEEDLLEFCNSNLAFLLDKGFKLEIEETSVNRFSIRIFKYNDHRAEWYHLSEIEDEFIPFLEYLKSKYDLVGSSVAIKLRQNNLTYYIDELIDNKDSFLEDRAYLKNAKINSIELRIKL